MARSEKIRLSTPRRLSSKLSTISGSPSLCWLSRQSKLSAALLVWEAIHETELHLAAGMKPSLEARREILKELRIFLPSPAPRVLAQPELAGSPALAALAREAQAGSLLLAGLGTGKFLIAVDSSTNSWSAARIAGIERQISPRASSALPGWIEAECRAEEIDAARKRGERRLLAFHEAVQWLASQKDPAQLPATLLEAARKIVPFEGMTSLETLQSSPGLCSEDAALLRKLGEFYNLQVQSHRLQNLVEIAARMESANALARGLAHDFNNSLGILLGYTAFLREKLVGQEDMQAELDGIERAAGRAIGLTEKLASFSKQRRAMKRERVQVERLVAEFLPSLQQSLGDAILPQIDAPRNLAAIESTPEQIQEILTHLALNARDAMPRGGHFILRLREITAEQVRDTGSAAHASPGSAWVLLEACDSGPGIPPALLARIFEPFFTTKEGKEGAGLGCAMIYSIVRSNGGWVEVDSPPGQGARFRVFLPVAGSQQPPR